MILVNDQIEAKQKNLKKEDQNPSVGINPDRTIKDQNESEKLKCFNHHKRQKSRIHFKRFQKEEL